MMRLKVEEKGSGLHPNEVVVTFKTVDGAVERMRLSRQSLAGGAIEVGILRSEGSKSLIELPRETQRGAWRVWVSEDQLLQQERMRA